MSYFKRLFLGESVKTTGKASFKSLSESEPTPTYTVSGVWEFYDSIYLDYSRDIEATINFTTNSVSFTKMTARMGDGLYYNNSRVYRPPTWTNNAYKTVDFGATPQTVSQEFYSWLTANARPRIMFQIVDYDDGTLRNYFAYEGMTWGEWVDSSFNLRAYYRVDLFIKRQTSSGKIVNLLGIHYTDTIISEQIYEESYREK